MTSQFFSPWAVLSRRPPPNHDAGSFTEHRDLEDAQNCADKVNGTVWLVSHDGTQLERYIP